jgi:spermidine synthase
VREGRGGLELRVDGTLASLYRPRDAATGAVWRALAAPLAALPPERLRRVLLLGLGGGSAVRVVRALAPRAQIVGVEIDAEVLAAARRHFGLAALGVETRLGDARSVLRHERRRFDAVIEDVFVGDARSVRKPDWLLEDGLQLAWRRVAPGGLLVSNTLHEARRVARALQAFPGALLELAVRGYWNRILAVGTSLPDARGLRRALTAHAELRPALGRLALRTLRAPR